MKIFDNIIGQPQAIAILQDAVKAAQSGIETQEMTHSWLFTGPPGSGRSIAAACFAASLVCPNNGCGVCVDCETALSGSHVDVEMVKSEGLSIKVDEIRELIMRSSWAPSISGWRVVILNDAERLTEAAANALLKVIEDTSNRIVWILCSPSIADVLPTIRSRCRLLALRTPTHEAIVQLLIKRDGISPEVADYASRVSQGHIGRAKYLAQNPESRNRRNQILNLVLNIKTVEDSFRFATELIRISTEEAKSRIENLNDIELSNFNIAYQGKGRAFVAGGAKVIKDLEREQKSRQTRIVREAIENTIQDITSLFRDVMLMQYSTGVTSINIDLKEKIESLTATKSPTQVLRTLDSLMRARLALMQNSSPLLVLEDIAVSVLQGS